MYSSFSYILVTLPRLLFKMNQVLYENVIRQSTIQILTEFHRMICHDSGVYMFISQQTLIKVTWFQLPYQECFFFFLVFEIYCLSNLHIIPLIFMTLYSLS